ncbi:MAG TPA: NAD(P)-dependent oxidoreductase [Chloroflexota bacterium]|jgi:3-hydroxyisobutyrate dehydrogenase|nr:NAD(P)-dependent oxidoreductase [Chloroflexota bacterium]
MATATLGMIGLGRMGRPMAERLVAAGHRVVGYDRAGTAERLPAGATAAASAVEVAATAEVVFLSLPDGTASRTVCAEIAAAPARRAHTVVDLSTIGPTAARACAETLAAARVRYVDAPVSGGVRGAEQGTLTVMVGAPAELFAAVEPWLAVLGRHRVRVGDAPGQGQAMKLLNNYLSALALAATSEAVAFGARHGLDPALVIDVLNVSTGRTSASADKFPRCVLPRTYDYGFAGALMAKDIALYHEAAEAVGAPRELATPLHQLWQRFRAAHPDADCTYIAAYIAESAP